jgi:tRNA dimethylallyltransferase
LRYDQALPAFTAFGYHEAFAVLDGKLTVEQAIDQDAARTWQFARRQRTWFRAEPDINWLEAATVDLEGRAYSIALTAFAQGNGAG